MLADQRKVQAERAEGSRSSDGCWSHARKSVLSARGQGTRNDAKIWWVYSGVLTQSHTALFQVRVSISDTVIKSKISVTSRICSNLFYSMSNCWLKILKPFCKTQLAGFLPPVFPSHISTRRTHVYLTAVNTSDASVAIAAKHESTTAWAQSGREGPRIPSIATWSSHDIGATHTQK